MTCASAGCGRDAVVVMSCGGDRVVLLPMCRHCGLVALDEMPGRLVTRRIPQPRRRRARTA